VLIMGLPGAGKSTLARGMAADGYARLNRDEAGGSLKGLLPALDRAIESGASRIVLDNTYLSRQSRAVVRDARTRGALSMAVDEPRRRASQRRYTHRLALRPPADCGRDAGEE
jgi:predicted kinase